MKENKMKFRDLDVFFDYGQVDVNVIKSVESEFNIHFPKTFIQLMSIHNGVSFYKETFDYYDSYRNEYALSTFGFDGFKTDDNGILDDIRAQYLYDDIEYGYPHIYSFGSSANGDWVCFDYREDPTTDEPKICIVIHDEYDEETGKRLLFPVANNFDEFLGMLYDFNEKYPL